MGAVPGPESDRAVRQPIRFHLANGFEMHRHVFGTWRGFLTWLAVLAVAIAAFVVLLVDGFTGWALALFMLALYPIEYLLVSWQISRCPPDPNLPLRFPIGRTTRWVWSTPARHAAYQAQLFLVSLSIIVLVPHGAWVLVAPAVPLLGWAWVWRKVTQLPPPPSQTIQGPSASGMSGQVVADGPDRSPS